MVGRWGSGVTEFREKPRQSLENSHEHAAILALLRDVLGNRLTDRVAREIQRVIAEKDKFEYHGYVTTLTEARALLDRAERIGAWCEEWLSVTPRLRS